MSRRTCYQYMIGPGNNSAAIEAALKKRNVWEPLSVEKELFLAHFLWRQNNYPAQVYDDLEEMMKAYPERQILVNHFEANSLITTKSGLLRTLKYYYTHDCTGKAFSLFEVVPTAYTVYAHKETTEFKDFLEKYSQISQGKFIREKLPEKHCRHNVWFIKPESENQGRGITVLVNLKEILAFLNSKPVNSGWILQKAIERPLLYYGRKFDVRAWVLVTIDFKVYYHIAPYMRTSSQVYSLEDMNCEIHLTNNSQQKKFSDYSKFEDGNTLPISVLWEYLSKTNGCAAASQAEATFTSSVKQIIIDTMLSVRKQFTRSSRKKQFQLFGYDFLLDEDYRVWLLEVNNNPYIGTPNDFTKELVPAMIDEMLEITVDPYYPPKDYTSLAVRKFQLIYQHPSGFRITPIRTQRSNSETRKTTSDIQASETSCVKEAPKIRYSTPAETIRFLLNSYCFADLDPFYVPVTLILTSTRLKQEQKLQANLKNLRLITESRVAGTLVSGNMTEKIVPILTQECYHWKIKSVLIQGINAACKHFKQRLHVLKHYTSQISAMVHAYGSKLEEEFAENVILLLIRLGGFIERSLFIPGESRENEFIREVFIRSNTLALLLLIRKRYPSIAKEQFTVFEANLSQHDWELFFDVSDNKQKRAFSPKIRTSPCDSENILVSIKTNFMNQERPRVTSQRQIAEIKGLTERRKSAFPSIRRI